MVLRVDQAVVERGSVAVIRRVSLEVKAGQVIALLGPSGAGKSSLFDAIAGELPLARGRIWLQGNDITKLPFWQRVRHGLGYVPQGPSVLFDLTVRQNLVTFSRLSGERREVKAQAESVGLTARLDIRVANLSGGERRRLELARALLFQPCLLICDEPFAGVDPVGIRALADRLRAYAVDGGALLLSDHHAAEALRIADEAYLLVDGQCEVKTAPDMFLTHPMVTQRYVSW